MRKCGRVNIIMYYPTSGSGRKELARRVSDAHASAVNQRLKSLNCPTQQKLALLDGIIDTIKKQSGEQA